MNIHLVTFGFGLADDLLKSFMSADQPEYTWHLFLHSQQKDVVDVCKKLSKRKNVRYYPYGENRGLAKSNNEAIMAAQDAGADVFICFADDVYVQPGAIDKIAQTVLDNPNCSFVESMGFVERTQRTEHLALTGGALNLKAIERIGYFDQNFDPFYFSDTDWMYRARLAGMQKVTAEGTHHIHAGSKTTTHVPGMAEVFERWFPAIKEHYINKWGGDGGQERYTQPFNDSKYGIEIPREVVNDPYPEYRRERELS